MYAMSLVKRSLSLSGHQTSVALEPEFWLALEQMAAAQGMAVSALLRRLDETRGARPLASAARVAALVWARSASDSEGGA
jgi:predicted DNA-binding ribbon-helix-helix protein